MSNEKQGITQLLVDWNAGNRAALDELFPLVYDELRRLANSYLRTERSDHTLQPTALVHEAYLRLINQREVNWQNRAQFFGLAAQMMRRILVNHARDRQADKRGGVGQKLALDDAVSFAVERDINLVALDEALQTLETLDAEHSRIVELRFFGGLTTKEVAEVLGVSEMTVNRKWSTAKLWLHAQLSPDTTP